MGRRNLDKKVRLLMSEGKSNFQIYNILTRSGYDKSQVGEILDKYAKDPKSASIYSHERTHPIYLFVFLLIFLVFIALGFHLFFGERDGNIEFVTNFVNRLNPSSFNQPTTYNEPDGLVIPEGNDPVENLEEENNLENIEEIPPNEEQLLPPGEIIENENIEPETIVQNDGSCGADINCFKNKLSSCSNTKFEYSYINTLSQADQTLNMNFEVLDDCNLQITLDSIEIKYSQSLVDNLLQNGLTQDIINQQEVQYNQRVDVIEKSSAICTKNDQNYNEITRLLEINEFNILNLENFDCSGDLLSNQVTDLLI